MHLVSFTHPNTIRIYYSLLLCTLNPSQTSLRFPPNSIPPNPIVLPEERGKAPLVELRGRGARLELPHTAIHGRRLRRQRPPQPIYMHQGIHWMSLVHDLCFFSSPRPSTRRRRRRLTDVAHSQLRPTTTTHNDTGPTYSVWVVCRARTQSLGAGLETHGVHHSARGHRYAASCLTQPYPRPRLPSLSRLAHRPCSLPTQQLPQQPDCHRTSPARPRLYAVAQSPASQDARRHARQHVCQHASTHTRGRMHSRSRPHTRSPSRLPSRSLALPPVPSPTHSPTLAHARPNAGRLASLFADQPACSPAAVHPRPPARLLAAPPARSLARPPPRPHVSALEAPPAPPPARLPARLLTRPPARPPAPYTHPCSHTRPPALSPAVVHPHLVGRLLASPPARTRTGTHARIRVRLPSRSPACPPAHLVTAGAPTTASAVALVTICSN